MQTNTFKARLARFAAASAVAATAAASLMAGVGVAGADPKQLEDPLVTMGSDTTQDILDAFTGEVNGTRFIPIRSASALSPAGIEVGQQQIASWRAVNLDSSGNPEACVEPAGGILVDRANGSGNGRRALTAAFGLNAGNPVGWGRTDVGCTTEYANMAGLIDFSRSSSGASGTSGDLTFVPFARDALQFAYSAPSGAAAVNDLTTTQVRDLHTNAGGSAVLLVDPDGAGPLGNTRIIACRIQSGSGTYESWAEDMFPGDSPPPSAANVAALEASTEECADAFDTVETGINGIQEHDPQGLEDVCDRIRTGYTPVGGGAPVAGQSNTQCIIGYSAANWVAQFNGVGNRALPVTPTAPTGGQFNLGIQGGGATAYTLAGGVASPNPTYYADTTFGRDVYNVVPSSVIALPGNLALKSMLLCDGPDAGTACDFNSEGPGSGPAICSPEAAVTRNLLGFGAPVDHACGQYGAFNKRAYDFSNTGPIGTPET
ncbi:MAG: hypothetical protein ACSLFP_06950 [Acidimicrobiales bacterium]